MWENIDEILDTLLDQEGLEVDPINRLEQDTPLHKAVRFINELDREQWESASSIAELLLDAGADPRSVITTVIATIGEVIRNTLFSHPKHSQGPQIANLRPSAPTEFATKPS